MLYILSSKNECSSELRLNRLIARLIDFNAGSQHDPTKPTELIKPRRHFFMILLSSPMLLFSSFVEQIRIACNIFLAWSIFMKFYNVALNFKFMT